MPFIALKVIKSRVTAYNVLFLLEFTYKNKVDREVYISLSTLFL